MAVLNSTIAYSGRKKIGTMVLRTVKGQLIASQHQPHVANPRSLGQMESRDKMRAIVESFRIVQSVVDVGMREFKKHRSKYNEYVSLNKTANVIEVDTNWVVDYQTLQLTKGSLDLIENISSSFSGGNVTITYDGGEFIVPQNANDEISYAIVAPSLNFSTQAQFTTRNTANTATFNAGIFPSNTKFFVYAFAINNLNKRGSATQFLSSYTA